MGEQLHMPLSDLFHVSFALPFVITNRFTSSGVPLVGSGA